jgi:4-alpha-glucanotransferase
MQWPRASGLLVHPTSLPGPYGIGDFGPAASRLLAFLASGRQRLWQVLPLGPTGFGNSPYALLSAFAGNPLLISPEQLIAEDLLTPADLAGLPAFPVRRVAYGQVVPWKHALLRRSHARFQCQANPALRDAYAQFRAAEADWLDDYALYAALKAAHAGAPWNHWDQPLARREPAALAAAANQYAGEIAFHTYLQFLFERQWQALRSEARARGVAIIGDLAIFVAHDSADVWAHPELFQLDEAGNPTVVAGVPPDYFSATGQLWGNPLYRWDALRASGYAWWVARVRRARALYDLIRLDHFRGFQAYWEVPASSETAIEGRWVPGPADDLFAALRSALGEIPLIAEDLGLITPDVQELRERLGLPGMRVLQFGFSGDASNIHLPHNFTRDVIVYTGTHDNDTTRGWFAACPPAEQSQVVSYLGCARRDIGWAMIRAAMASVAQLAVIPLQDVLGLGSAARMNRPARSSGNWEWRYTDAQLDPGLSERLNAFSALYGR